MDDELKRHQSDEKTLDELFGDDPDADPDPRKVQAFKRMMDFEQRLYDLWVERDERMSWIGELLGEPADGGDLWLYRMGERVALLGGYLEINAVFPDKTIPLLREPPGELEPPTPPQDEGERADDDEDDDYENDQDEDTEPPGPHR